MEITGALSSNDLKVLYQLIFDDVFKSSKQIKLTRNQLKVIANLCNLSLIEVQASINNLRFSEILKCAENCKYLYELDYEKAKKVLVISNGISDIRQQIFEKIKHQFCNLATLCEFPEVFSSVYDIENLDDAFFRLNQDIDAILNITQKLRNLNKVVYRLYSISQYFSDLLDVESEIKRLKDSVQEEA